MNKKYIRHTFITIIALLMSVNNAFTQNGEAPIRITNKTAEKSNNNVNVSFDIEINNDFNVNRNDLVMMTPVLYSNTSADSLELAPIVIIGKNRNKVVLRNQKYNNTSPIPANVHTTLKRQANSKQNIHFEESLSYQSWMRNARLDLRSTISGCATCEISMGNIPISNRLFPYLEYIPLYKLTYIAPEVEQVKSRSDKHSATFNFGVNKYNLLRDFKDNRQKFDEVDKIIREVQTDKNIQISKLNIVGYSSPEGNFESNRMLAENRANAFAEYLVTKFDMKRNILNVSSMGEDWEGLRKAIASSNINDKNEIIRIIDTVDNIDARDSHLLKLSGGSTYATLLNSYYPPLRRTDYTIEYVARAFDVEEAKEIIKTNPKHLSLNEMFLVAQSYPTGSEEFKKVFEIALQTFPDSEIAIANVVAATIEAGDNSEAIRLIETSKHKAKMLNNLGVAYARDNNLEKALEVLKDAATNDDYDAKHNINELNKHIKGLEE